MGKLQGIWHRHAPIIVLVPGLIGANYAWFWLQSNYTDKPLTEHPFVTVYIYYSHILSSFHVPSYLHRGYELIFVYSQISGRVYQNLSTKLEEWKKSEKKSD